MMLMSDISFQNRTDEDIDSMLTDALNNVKELSMERNKRIQIKFAKDTQKAIEMFTDYQESMVNLNPLKPNNSGKI
jgi:hypothetical protein